MSGRPSYGNSSGITRQPLGGMGGGMGQGYNTSISYAPGSMGAPATMGQNYGSAAGTYGAGQSGSGAYNMGGTFQQAPTTYQNGAAVNGSAPPGAGGTMTDLSALYGKLAAPSPGMGAPTGLLGQPAALAGPVGTGLRATNGLNTISFDDVDNYYRQMMGLR